MDHAFARFTATRSAPPPPSPAITKVIRITDHYRSFEGKCRDDIHHNERARRKCCGGEGSACRKRRDSQTWQPCGIDLIDGFEVFDVREQQCDFHDVGGRATGGVEYRVEVRQHASRLCFESWFECQGVWIAAGLARHKDEIAGANSLRVSAQRRRRAIGFDPYLVHHLLAP